MHMALHRHKCCQCDPDVSIHPRTPRMSSGQQHFAEVYNACSAAWQGAGQWRARTVPATCRMSGTPPQCCCCCAATKYAAGSNCVALRGQANTHPQLDPTYWVATPTQCSTCPKTLPANSGASPSSSALLAASASKPNRAALVLCGSVALLAAAHLPALRL